MAIRFFDMFAGIGGFRSGFEAVGGFECIGHCEIDKYANQAYNAIYQPKGEIFFEDARKSTRKTCLILTLFARVFPVRAFQSQDCEKDLKMTQEELSFLKSPELPPIKRPSFLLLENVPGLLSHDKGRTFATISIRWMNWGTMSHGKCLTARISESPNPERECILSDILETDVPEKYYLSQKQMERLLFKSFPEHRESVSTQTAESESP